MRELILRMFISLDGFAGSLDGDDRWMINPDPVGKAFLIEKMWDTSLQVVGANTFRGWARYWPDMTDDFALPMNRIAKAVFSSQGRAILDGIEARPGAESWARAHVASGDLADEINTLKAQDGKPMTVPGGIRLARSLIAHKLIDQFDLMVIPVVLGKGFPIFDALPAPQRLTLVNSKAFPKGTVFQSYRPA